MPFYKITKLFTLLRVNLIELFAIQKTKLYLGMTKYLALINSSSRSLYAFYLLQEMYSILLSRNVKSDGEGW